MNNIDGGQVWYYYDIPEPKPRQESQIPVSQIPVLNGVKPEELDKPAPRRGGEGIDSEYISLARAGGRKDLLLYKERKKNDEVKEYQRVDWFDHPDTNPDVLVGKPRVRNPPAPPAVTKNKKPVSMLVDDAPFGTDKFRVWSKTDEEDQDQYLTRQARRQREMNRTRPPPAPLPAPEPIFPTHNRIVKPPLGEVDDPVSFSHLLSHGYQVDWGKNMAETRKQKMESKRRVEREQKEKLTKHLTEMKKDSAVPVPDKPLFKIKKFANVAPKVVNS